MKKIAVLGVTGEKHLWLVDFDAGTVCQILEDTSAFLDKSANSREYEIVTQGIDIVVAIKMSAQGFSSKYAYV